MCERKEAASWYQLTIVFNCNCTGWPSAEPVSPHSMSFTLCNSLCGLTIKSHLQSAIFILSQVFDSSAWKLNNFPQIVPCDFKTSLFHLLVSPINILM